MTEPTRWGNVAAGALVVAATGAVLLLPGPRAGGDSVEVAAGPRSVAASPAARSATLVGADERGRIVELSAADGAEVAVLADEALTGGAVGSLAVTGDRRSLFLARHDPLVGLPCDGTVVALSLPAGKATTIGAGFAPTLSPDGGHLAYVGTEATPTGCAYAPRVRDLASGAETTWRLEADWAGHYGICSLAWDPAGSALVAQLCHGVDTVLHRVDLDRPGTLGDATYLGPRDRERSWTAASPGWSPGTVVVVERCCLSASPLEPSHRLVVVDAGTGEVGTVLAALPPSIESVTALSTGPEAELLLVASTFTGDGSTERQLLRWSGGELRLLGRGLVDAAW